MPSGAVWNSTAKNFRCIFVNSNKYRLISGSLWKVRLEKHTTGEHWRNKADPASSPTTFHAMESRLKEILGNRIILVA